MSGTRAPGSPGTERLSAAAGRILRVVRRMMRLHGPEVPPERHRAAVQEQLSLAADEIFGILEDLMSECDADVSRRRGASPDIRLKDRLSAPGCGNDISSEQQRREHSEIVKPPAQPRFTDASTETDAEPIHGRPSHLYRSAKSDITMMGAETGGQQCAVPSSGEETLSSNVKSNTSRTRRGVRQGQRAECCEMCGRSFHKDGGEVKINFETKKIAPANKSRPTGQSRCRVCGKGFRYKRSFLKHVLKHEQSTDLCGVCGTRLRPVESLKAHLRAHHEENGCGHQKDDRETSECSDWERSGGADGGGDKDEPNRGSRSRTAKLGTQIQASNAAERAKAKDRKDLSHLKYCCKVCSKAFCYRASFLKHVQEDERDTDVCGVCGKRYETEESLRLHLQTYLRTNDCEVCGKHFDGLKQLEMHMRTHTGEKPYVCSICGKAFAQNGNLMGHMRAHTGERPYVCSVCGQSFGFKEYMMAHMRIHTGEKPFLCSVCGKGFRQRGTLKTHTMLHTGESTHRCVVCDKTFYKSGALKIHMRAHTGERPYLCNVCGKRFSAGSSLSKHMTAHEGGRSHRCGVCSKGFLRKEDLEKHVRTHSSESRQLTSL